MLPDGFGLREACDLGMFTQTVMLGLTAQGLGSCPQTALGFMAKQIREVIDVPEHHKLMFGLSFGYPLIPRSMTWLQIGQILAQRSLSIVDSLLRGDNHAVAVDFKRSQLKCARL